MKKLIILFAGISVMMSCKKNNDKLNPSLSFTVNSRALGSADYTIRPPFSNSTGDFTYTSSNPNVATINGNTVSIKGLGTSVITATEASDDNFNGASITANLTVIPAGAFVVGQAVPGGIVFYVDGTGVHGYMISDVDVSTGLPWSTGNLAATSATLNTLGGGLSNTNAIINAFGSGAYAAQACKGYNGGGFTDWYMPCQLELVNIRQQKDKIGLPNSNYWSSTEVSSTPANAVYIYMGTGTLTTVTYGSTTTTTTTTYTFSKLYPYSVRAIRAF